MEEPENDAATRKNRMESVMQIIIELQKISKPVATTSIIAEAEKQGINEVQCRDLLSRLARDGDLYEPRPGFVRRAY
jgi:DNA replicative helicase MCM subunit Mcm2 (Cdc46/Mcm family)